MFGVGEWLLVGGIAVLIFGPGLFVKTARSLGQGVAEFKQAVDTGEKDSEEESSEASEPQEARKA